MHLGRLANSGAQCWSNLLCCLTLAPSRWMGFWLSKALHPVASAPSCCTSVINDSWAWFLHLWWIWLVEGRLLLHSPHENEQFYPWSTSEHKFLPCSPTCWDTAFMVSDFNNTGSTKYRCHRSRSPVIRFLWQHIAWLFFFWQHLFAKLFFFPHSLHYVPHAGQDSRRALWLSAQL